MTLHFENWSHHVDDMGTAACLRGPGPCAEGIVEDHIPEELKPPAHAEHVAHMEPISEEQERSIATDGSAEELQQLSAAAGAGASTAQAIPIPRSSMGTEGFHESTQAVQSPPQGGSWKQAMNIFSSPRNSRRGSSSGWPDTASVPGFGQDTAASSDSDRHVHSSAPSPRALAAAAALAANVAKKTPLLQRLSLGMGKAPSPPKSGGSPPSDSKKSSGDTASKTEVEQDRSSISKRMGNALSRVSASFRPVFMFSEDRATAPAATMSSDMRPLGANSVPITSSEPERCSKGVRPNLRRRGCYTGLVGSYRMNTVPEEAAEANGRSAAGDCEEKKQLDELNVWLKETTQPWKQHSSRLHRMQAEALMQEERRKAEEPQVVLPRGPPKHMLKTFSMNPGQLK